MSQDKLISWDEWEETYKPITNPNSLDNGFWGNMFETYGSDLEYLKQHHTHNRNLWTLVDNNPNSVYLDVVPGYHLFNRMGYFVTENPWKEEDKYMVVSNDPSYKE